MMITPFWSIGLTSVHLTEIVVGDVAIAVTFLGGVLGAKEDVQILTVAQLLH